MNKQKITILFFSGLLIATLSHLFFLRQWMEGTFMAGPNDGLNQMIPFKQFLYENYTSWEFLLFARFRFWRRIFRSVGLLLLNKPLLPCDGGSGLFIGVAACNWKARLIVLGSSYYIQQHHSHDPCHFAYHLCF